MASKLYMVVVDGHVLDIVEAAEVGDEHRADIGGQEGNQDMRAARLRACGLTVADIAEAMDASEYRVRRMLMRIDSGRWDE